MKICKCVKCKKEFSMNDNFMGTILCEDCDPFMNPEPQRGEIMDREEIAKEICKLSCGFYDDENTCDCIPLSCNFELVNWHIAEVEKAKREVLIKILDKLKDSNIFESGYVAGIISAMLQEKGGE